MKNRTTARVRGFTMTELAVVMASAALLASSSLPAIQQAREAARRTQCKNNLKQIGLALHNYHDVFGCLPPGWVAHHANSESVPGFGWQTFILPFVDQAGLYNRLDFNRPLLAAGGIFQHVIPHYRCPSDPTEETNSMRSDYGTSNYSGSHGDVALPRWAPGPLNRFWPGEVDTPQTANGLFFWNSSVRFRDIRDGTSLTFLVGERCVTGAAGIWPGVTSNRNENDQVTDCSPGNEINSGLTAFSSLHEGGTHFVMCDGAVRFISEKIASKRGEGAEMGTYQKLGNRSDGVSIGEF